MPENETVVFELATPSVKDQITSTAIAVGVTAVAYVVGFGLLGLIGTVAGKISDRKARKEELKKQ